MTCSKGVRTEYECVVRGLSEEEITLYPQSSPCSLRPAKCLFLVLVNRRESVTADQNMMLCKAALLGGLVASASAFNPPPIALLPSTKVSYVMLWSTVSPTSVVPPPPLASSCPMNTFTENLLITITEGGETNRTSQMPSRTERAIMHFKTNGHPLRAKPTPLLSPSPLASSYSLRPYTKFLPLTIIKRAENNRTWQIPPGSESAIMHIKTNNRPLRAKSTPLLPPSPPATSSPPSLLASSYTLSPFVENLPMTRIEGGTTNRIWLMPPGTERAIIHIMTNGRPLRAKVELFVGPIRTAHTLMISNQDGSETPHRAVLRFKPGPWVIRITNTGSPEFPLLAGVEAASPERSKELATITQRSWNRRTPVTLQGSSYRDGAVRTFPIDTDVESVQVLCFSASGKGLKVKIEMIQGPSNTRQSYDLQCSGGSQPYHAMFQTPGPGWTIRMVSKNYLEYPCQVVVVPFKMADGKSLTATSNPNPYEGGGHAGGHHGNANRRKREWWN